MLETHEQSNRAQRPDNLQWLCDGCNYAISPAQEFVRIEVRQCTRRDNQAVPSELISDSKYFCVHCAKNCNFEAIHIPKCG
jgi:hypothetical protein